MPLNSGANTLMATAQDSLGLRDTNTVTVNLPATAVFAYDDNGNLTSDGLRSFYYNEANQLTMVKVANAWQSEFVYDGLGRRRIRREYTWQGSTFTLTNEVRYVYDGSLVIQERDANNFPLINYTRGLDLSGSLQGAGGIGGLLARTDHTVQPFSHAYYHADANGNITALINQRQAIVARYSYDPFGNVLSLSGPLASVNLYRYSSKEIHPNSGLVYYGFRYYEPNLQRWLNQDPLGEEGGINLYMFVNNCPLDLIDPNGLVVKFYTLDKNGVLVPFEPSEKQKKRFDDAMQKMKCAGGVGLALYNWTYSDQNTLEVVNIPGEIASEVYSIAKFDMKGHRELWEEGKNPAIGIDLGKDTLTAIPKRMSKDQIPPHGAITLVHELSHAIIGLGEGWNIAFAENPARKALGFSKRETRSGINIEKWYKRQVNTMKSYVDNMSQDVQTFIQDWSSRKN